MSVTVIGFGDGEEVIWRSGWFWLIVAIVLVLIIVYLASASLEAG
jgi:hypothetical protein